jgi:hypothetical protein
MRVVRTGLSCALLLAANSGAWGQPLPVAVQRLAVSGFGGVSGVYTGLGCGHNIGVTAGVDVGLPPVFSLYPSIEVRGTYPLDKGAVDSLKNILGGIKLAKYFGRLHPFGDLLYGRGEISYGSGYVTPSGNLRYVQSVSNVVAVGGGLDLAVAEHFALKFDGQLERYGSPVTVSGYLYAKTFTAALVYRLSFGHGTP